MYNTKIMRKKWLLLLFVAVVVIYQVIADQKIFFVEYPFTCQPVLYYDFDKICAGEIFDESGSGNNGMSRGSVLVEAGYNEDNGVDLSDGFIQLDGNNFKVDNNFDMCSFSVFYT